MHPIDPLSPENHADYFAWLVKQGEGVGYKRLDSDEDEIAFLPNRKENLDGYRKHLAKLAKGK